MVSGYDRIRIILPVWLSLFISGWAVAADSPALAELPEDFPRFEVPGAEHEMRLLENLFYRHMHNPAGPLATLWDEWMSRSTIWPAVEGDPAMRPNMRQAWRTALAGRYIDSEGYVATHQHPSIAHQHGWPFPFWMQGGLAAGAWGWHFSPPPLNPIWHGVAAQTQEGWQLFNGHDVGIKDGYWTLELTEPLTAVQTPPTAIRVQQAPFMQLRWRARDIGRLQPYVEWTTETQSEFSPERRFYFDPPAGNDLVYTMIPLYRHPQWQGKITALRIQFNNPEPAGTVEIKAFFTQYDTRHIINNQNFVLGCANYFDWTRDFAFLRDQVQRMRLALRWLMVDCRGLEEKVIVAPFVGHDGLPGIIRDEQGKRLNPGHAIGHNYWDILPCGKKDLLATAYYVDALRKMADLEQCLLDNPGWNIPAGPMAFEPEKLRAHADEVVETARKVFWNPGTERFVLGIDVNGDFHDYGAAFANIEAVAYGIADRRQAEKVYAWLDGKRIVPGDTSQGEDIYHWRFAPRATTKRNLSWYNWGWSSPESLEFGDQVQDGGAVLGFSYYDMMARLELFGPDNAQQRLGGILDWYDEVLQAGGYREYYKQPGRGSLQGGGTAGGLGMDCEFFESVLIPQVMLYGFMGFEPTPDGFAIDPRLPSDWPSLAIDRIGLHNLVLSIKATPDGIEIGRQGLPRHPYTVTIPAGQWTAQLLDDTGAELRSWSIDSPQRPAQVIFDWAEETKIRFVRRK